MSTTDALKAQLTPATAPAQQLKANSLIDVVRSKGFQTQMALALPKSMTAERLTRIVMTECRKTPALLKCAPESFYGAVLQCAALGLEPGSALGHCYLLPFGNGKDREGRPNAQLIIGYRGMIDLARRSGQIISLSAYCVHEQDTFNYHLGLDPDIEHVPASTADRGKVTHVYAVAKWDEMAKKTVIRRLFKYLPVSIEAARAVEIDEKSDRGEAVTQQEFLEGEFIDKGTPETFSQTAPASDQPESGV